MLRAGLQRSGPLALPPEPRRRRSDSQKVEGLSYPKPENRQAPSFNGFFEDQGKKVDLQWLKTRRGTQRVF
jgi:hypothetical protein